MAKEYMAGILKKKNQQNGVEFNEDRKTHN